MLSPSVAPKGTHLGCEYQVACTKHCIADDAAVNDDGHQENHHHAELGASRGAVTGERQAISVTVSQHSLEETVLPEQGPKAPSP